MRDENKNFRLGVRIKQNRSILEYLRCWYQIKNQCCFQKISEVGHVCSISKFCCFSFCFFLDIVGLVATMDSFKGQGGIQMLLTAEQEAQHIVSSARNLKMARLKQAKEEAEKDVALFRSQMETEYQNKISESSGSSDNTVKRLEEETDKRIKALTKSTSMVSKEIIEILMKHVTSVKI
ncbi:hypothetical protein Golax_025604 [Gossypium laxum]|uniref:V-type proton ATPase subunit G n=3 Tax=Gossypium TaxID=3633 RepID=A0A7J9B2S6_9ROSI|nr:hypothetical protein [Gossypium laxum]